MHLFFIIVIILNATLQTVSTDLSPRIIHGSVAKPGQIPYIVSLSLYSSHFCGGSIISDRHILTAEHCVRIKNQSIPIRYLKVTAGQHLLTANTGIVRTVKRVYERNNYLNDIAILELNQPLPINNNNIYVSKIPISTTEVLPNTWCTVSGWGDQIYNANKTSNALLTVNVSLIKYNKCNQMYEKVSAKIPSDVICAGDDNGDSCQGDSGGPLVCNGFITGIVSSGYECASKYYPGLYTNVSIYSKWIQEIINLNSFTPGPSIVDNNGRNNTVQINIPLIPINSPDSIPPPNIVMPGIMISSAVFIFDHIIICYNFIIVTIIIKFI